MKRILPVILFTIMFLLFSCSSGILGGNIPFWYMDQNRFGKDRVYIFASSLGESEDSSYILCAMEILEKLKVMLGKDLLPEEFRTSLINTKGISKIDLRKENMDYIKQSNGINCYCEFSFSRKIVENLTEYNFKQFEKMEKVVESLFKEGRECYRNVRDQEAFSKFTEAIIISNKYKITRSQYNAKELEKYLINIVKDIGISGKVDNLGRVRGRIYRKSGIYKNPIKSIWVSSQIANRENDKDHIFYSGSVLSNENGEFYYTPPEKSIYKKGIVILTPHLERDLSNLAANYSVSFANKLNEILESRKVKFAYNRKTHKKSVSLLSFENMDRANPNIQTSNIVATNIGNELKDSNIIKLETTEETSIQNAGELLASIKTKDDYIFVLFLNLYSLDSFSDTSVGLTATYRYKIYDKNKKEVFDSEDQWLYSESKDEGRAIDAMYKKLNKIVTMQLGRYLL